MLLIEANVISTVSEEILLLTLLRMGVIARLLLLIIRKLFLLVYSIALSRAVIISRISLDRSLFMDHL